MKVDTGIDARGNRFIVNMYGKYYGSFGTLAEAQAHRDMHRHTDRRFGKKGGRKVRTAQMVEGFGERLDKAIKDNGITPVELEKQIGICHGGIYSYINYGMMPSCLRLAKIATVLNVTCDWLLGLEGGRG